MRISFSKPLHYILHYRIYRRMLGAFAVLVLLSVLLSSGVLYKLYAEAATKQTAETTTQMLEQVSYSAEVVWDQMHAVCSVMMRNPRILNFLALRSDDKVVKYHAQLELSLFKAIYPFITDISLINNAANVEISSTGLHRNLFVFGVQEDQSTHFIPRVVKPYLGDRRDVQTTVLSFYYPVSSTHTQGLKGGIIIDINAEHLQNTITGIAGENPANNIFIVDLSGIVISHGSPDWISENVSDEAYIQEILHAEALRGSYIASIDDQLMLIAYNKLSSAPNWCFISIQSAELLLQPITALMRNTVMLVAAVAAVCLILSTVVSQHIYNPVKELTERAMRFIGMPGLGHKAMDEYRVLDDAFSVMQRETNTMQISLAHSRNTLKQHYIRELFLGQITTEALPADVFESIRGLHPSPAYSVAAIRPYPEGGMPPEDEAVMNFSIANIARELMPDAPLHEVVEMPTAVALLFRRESPLHEDQVQLALLELMRMMQKHFGLSTAIGVSGWQKYGHSLDTIYRSALRALDESFYLGAGRIIEPGACRAYADIPLPDPLVGRAVDRLYAADEEGLNGEIEEVKRHLQGHSPESCRAGAAAFILALSEKFHVPVSVGDMERTLCFDALWRLFEENIQLIYKEWVDVYSNRAAKNNAAVVSMVAQYIENHYTDPELSLAELAQVVGLSPSYLGRVFKAVKCQSVGDYLTAVRLEHARVLLETTGEPVGGIAEAVGLRNAAYFSTLFKKAFGMSPSRYRVIKAG